MPVFKRKHRGKLTWFYKFDAPGSSRTNRHRIQGYGFATKSAAIDAEAARHIEAQQKYDLAQTGALVADEELPKTLAMLVEQFFQQYANDKLAPKSTERYREQVSYLDAGLLAMPIADITPLHLHREWERLLHCGGHTRRDKTPRPMAAKTVRNIAGMVSSMFSRAIRWGFIAANPATNSEPPIPKKHQGIALTTEQTDLLIHAASGPWCLPEFIALSAALGTRRGELLALRWSDITDCRATIGRSLTQTKQVLKFKGTKTNSVRVISVPNDLAPVLEDLRKRQDEFRAQFGPDYRSDLDLIFANPDGTPLKPDSVSSAVSLLFRRLKLPKGASLHTLRHTHGSHLLASGVPLQDVSERLGHSSQIITAEVYAHSVRGQDDKAAEMWSAFQAKSRAGIKKGIQ